MKTNLRGILPLVFLATVGWAQPQVVGELNESIYVKSAAGINGQLYYSASNRLHFVRPDRGYSEEIFNFDANGSAENLKNVDETLYFTTTDQNNNASLW